MEIAYQRELISNKKLIKSKVVCNFFTGATSKDFVHYIKPTLQENEFDTSILHMGINDVLKLGSNIDTMSKDIINIANGCKNSGVKQIIISGLALITRLNASFIYHLNNSTKVLCQNMVIDLLITATYHLRIYGKMDYI